MSYGGDEECETMQVDSRNVGRIIGKGGSKIRQIQDDSRAKIQVAREEDRSGMKTVEIRGSYEEVKHAKELIDDALNSADFGGGSGGGRRGGGGGYGGGFGGGRRDDRRNGGDDYGRRDNYGDRRGGGGGGRGGFGSDGDGETIYVDSSEVGRIIGRGGSRIREMEEDSGCRIKVSRDQTSDGLSSVELSGSKHAIADAKKFIQDAGVEIVREGDSRGRGW